MMLEVAYADGDGVPKNEAESFRLLRISAEQDNPTTQYLLGLKLANHKSDSDRAEAVKWLRLSAEQGFSTAQMTLGFFYQNGMCVSKDAVEAFVWLKLAADQSNGKFKVPPEVLDELTPGQLATVSRRVASFKPLKSKMPELMSDELTK